MEPAAIMVFDVALLSGIQRRDSHRNRCVSRYFL
jgi:hypothetical protein